MGGREKMSKSEKENKKIKKKKRFFVATKRRQGENSVRCQCYTIYMFCALPKKKKRSGNRILD